MALRALSNADPADGHVALLDVTGLALRPGERLVLIGRNGAGKLSLLLTEVGGQEKLDDNRLQMALDLRICDAPQEPVFKPLHSVHRVRSCYYCVTANKYKPGLTQRSGGERQLVDGLFAGSGLGKRGT